MKIIVFGTAVLGVVGFAAFGRAGHDFKGKVNRPPAEVYSLFSDAVVTPSTGMLAESFGEGADSETERTSPKSIRSRITVRGREATALNLQFEPADGGSATQVTADYIIDTAVLADAERRKGPGGTNISKVPDFLLKAAVRGDFAKAVEKMNDGSFLASRDLRFLSGGSEHGSQL